MRSIFIEVSGLNTYLFDHIFNNNCKIVVFHQSNSAEMSVKVSKTCSPEVWIAEHGEAYEQSKLIGVYCSRENAERACLTYMTTKYTGTFTKDVDQDDQVEWDTGCEIIRMTRHEVE